MFIIKELKTKTSYSIDLITLTIFAYFLNIKFSYAYINPGILGMFLQFFVAIIAFVWLFFSRIKVLFKTVFRKKKHIKKDTKD